MPYERSLIRILTLGIIVVVATGHANAQTAYSSDIRSRLRPIGTPTAVDGMRALKSAARNRAVETQYRSDQTASPNAGQRRGPIPQRQRGLSATPISNRTPGQPIAQVAQAPLPPINGGTPSIEGFNSNTALPPIDRSVPAPGVSGRTLPAPGSALSPQPGSGVVNDFTPVPQPQLPGSLRGGNSFATSGNSPFVASASPYTAAIYGQCGSTCGPAGYAPATNPVVNAGPLVAGPMIAAPTTGFGGPLTFTGAPAASGIPLAAVNSGAPVRPLVTLGQSGFPVTVGQGILGQPKAYVDGQFFRNWLRYLTP